MNSGHVTDGALAAVPERTALVVGERSWTYRELEEPVSYTHLTLPTNREV